MRWERTAGARRGEYRGTGACGDCTPDICHIAPLTVVTCGRTSGTLSSFGIMHARLRMPATEEQRPDLASLRIHREEEHESAGMPIVRIIVWIVAAIAIGAIAYAVYTRVVVPRRPPIVEP